MSKYKKSMFNVVKPQKNGDVLMYNSRTGAIVVLSQSAYKEFENESLKDISTLLKYGFMVENTTYELAELANIKVNTKKKKKGKITFTNLDTTY